jgi:hypothetical protein
MTEGDKYEQENIGQDGNGRAYARASFLRPSLSVLDANPIIDYDTSAFDSSNSIVMAVCGSVWRLLVGNCCGWRVCC